MTDAEQESIECKKCHVRKSTHGFYVAKNGVLITRECKACVLRRQSAQRYKRSHRLISVEINGVTRTLVEWARESGIQVQALGARWRNGVRGEALLAQRVRKGCENLPPGLISERSATSWDEIVYDRDLHAQRCVSYAVEECGLTLDQVGAIMGNISRERVRQIEESAIRKIRGLSSRAKHLSDMSDRVRWNWFVRAIENREISKHEALALIEMVAHEIVHGVPLIDDEAIRSHVSDPNGSDGAWVFPEGGP